jgi:hypothetical protein
MRTLRNARKTAFLFAASAGNRPMSEDRSYELRRKKRVYRVIIGHLRLAGDHFLVGKPIGINDLPEFGGLSAFFRQNRSNFH